MTRETRREERRIVAAGGEIAGSLALPDKALGLVLFAHGSGSSRFSPRNNYVAEVLNAAGLATLLVDLLTPQEEEVDLVTRRLRFDIELLSARVVAAIDWLGGDGELSKLPLGLFGSSTGAAAALRAAAARAEEVEAVVSRGGRPDLAGEALEAVRAPTLMLVGSLDDAVIGLNEEAAQRLGAPWQLRLIEGATHLFEEPGKLEEVAAQARDWFLEYLPDAG